MLKEFLEDNMILVVPNGIRKSIIKEISSLNTMYNIKYMSLEELINSFTFTYDEKSIYYLIKKYNMNYDVACMYLSNIKYIDSNDYGVDKLKKLKEIKKELLENEFLIIDENIKALLKDKSIVIYGYSYIDNFSMNIIEKIKTITKVEIIDKKYNENKHDIYEFNSIDDEVSFVATKICELIQSGVSINNIKLTNVSSEYYSVLKRIFSLFNININLKPEKGLASNIIFCDFIKQLEEQSIEETLDYISKKYDLSNEYNLYIYDEIIKILNKYDFVTEKEILIEILKKELSKLKTKAKVYENAVNIIDLIDSNVSDEDYVFLVGFNMENIPYIHKDEDYLSDEIKEKLNIEKSYEVNKIEKEIIINTIKDIKNLIITYKLKTNFDSYKPSLLIEKLGYDVIKNEKIDYSYSNKFNKLTFSKKMDNLIKYGIKDDDINVLYNNYSDINYLSYDNKFKGIDKNKLDSILSKKYLSYTSMDTYNKCAFRYYLDNILKITEFEETYMQFIGNLFHDILSKAFKEPFDFDKEFNDFISEKEFLNKEQFFLNKLKEDLKFIIETIKKHNKFCTLDEALYEKELYVPKNKNIKLTFMGKVDKILFQKENDKVYLVIIDYKTGEPKTNLNNAIYGINMQLPVYLYLTKNGLFENAEVIGFYFQKILDNEVKREIGKDYKKLKEENLKLLGYTIDKPELVEKFDFTYKNSEVVKSLKFGNNGFYANSKIINKEKINKLIDLVEKHIENTRNNVLSANFEINPKRIGKDLIGCEYCEHKDICYMTENDIVELIEHKDLDFLD